MNTTETRESVGSAGNYLAMLKEHYRPLFLHEAATVIDMTDVKEAVTVTVMIVDKLGAHCCPE